MMELVRACPLCDHLDHTPFDRREFRGRSVENSRCRNCGLVFLSPRMTAQELEEFYTEEYRRLYQHTEGPSEKDLNVQRARAASLATFLGSKVSGLSRHLDIGSSTGELLERIRKIFNTQPVGIEPGDSYRAHASRQGLRIYASLDALQADDKAPFDLISMAHVLEHLPDPVAYLRELRENYLHPNGWLLLEVPNLYAHDSFEVAHLMAFSAHTLGQVVRRAGFEVVALKKHGQPRSRLLPLYLTLLARPLDGSSVPELRPERFVPLKRSVGMLRRRVLSHLFPKLAWVSV